MKITTTNILTRHSDDDYSSLALPWALGRTRGEGWVVLAMGLSRWSRDTVRKAVAAALRLHDAPGC